MAGHRHPDLAGKRFAMLTAVSFVRASKAGQSYWLFRCDCGTEKEIRAGHAKSGQIKSCGCSSGALNSAHHIKHGYWKGGVSAPEYSAWCLARNRCHNPGAHAYGDYGARGIAMCDRWRFGEGGKSGFECFIADMGDRPSSKHSLEREDNDKGYWPHNCRWATRSEQMRNTRRNHIVEFAGRKMCLTEAIEVAGSVIEIDRVVKRLKRGWRADDAVSIPSLRKVA